MNLHSGCLDFIKTEWDRELDAASLLPGKYTFEKYVTGAFLGDLARRVLLGVLANLGKPAPSCFSTSDSLSTANLSEIVAASLPGGQKSSMLDVLEKDVAAILTHICILLSERAALMVAVPMSAFLNRMAKPTTTIAVTGSLYKHHPTLSKRLDYHTKTMSSYQFAFRLKSNNLEF